MEAEHGKLILQSTIAESSRKDWLLTCFWLQEDAHIADAQFNGDPEQALFGVFDGHGGREVAVYCGARYKEILNGIDSKALPGDRDAQVREWLRKSFLKVDEELRADLKKEEGAGILAAYRKEQPPKKPHILKILGDAEKKEPKEQSPEEMMLDAVGCTANVVYVDKKNKKIYVSNAGDSRCVMSKGGKAVQMSFDHKPNDEGERRRIEAAGSEVNNEGRVDGNLNLSRSLGDLKSKHREHLAPEDQAITANPDTYVYELTDDIDFILMGCDGIWEKNDCDRAVEWMHERLKG